MPTPKRKNKKSKLPTPTTSPSPSPKKTRQVSPPISAAEEETYAPGETAESSAKKAAEAWSSPPDHYKPAISLNSPNPRKTASTNSSPQSGSESVFSASVSVTTVATSLATLPSNQTPKQNTPVYSNSVVGLGQQGDGSVFEDDAPVPTTAETVAVCVRMRPPSAKERNNMQSEKHSAWDVDSSLGLICPSETLTDQKRNFSTGEYHFDKALYGSDNETLYDSCVKNIVASSMAGINGTVFAYGQTASGKSYSMMGTNDSPGVIPRAIEDIFSHIRESTSKEFLLRVSMLEIYNEQLCDLLAPETTNISIREDKKRIYVSPLKEEIVTTPEHVLSVIARGEENRHTSSTDYNEHSSRSHLVFSMIIESRERIAGLYNTLMNKTATDSPGLGRVASGTHVKMSQLNLIDLAGSERATSQIDRRKEGAFINKSLLTLGTVIARLTDEKSGQHVPYRDSKLTRILQTSLAGNARIAVICTISPTIEHATETSSTLKFAQRVKQVKTNAKTNEVMDATTLLTKYRDEIMTLKAQLKATNEGDPHAELKQLSKLKEEKMKHQEEVVELQLQRTTLKNQIDHLTELILTSSGLNRRESLNAFASMKRVSASRKSLDINNMPESAKMVGQRLEDVKNVMAAKDARIAELEAALQVTAKEVEAPSQVQDLDDDAIAHIKSEKKLAEICLGLEHDKESSIAKMTAMEENLSNLDASLTEKKVEIERLQTDNRRLAEAKDKLIELEGKHAQQTAALRELEAVAEDKQRESLKKIAHLESQMEILEREKTNLKRSLSVRSKAPSAPSSPEKDDRLQALSNQVRELRAELKDKVSEVVALTDQLRRERNESTSYAESMELEMENALADRDRQVTETAHQLKMQKDKMSIQKQTISDLEAEVKDLTAEMTRCENQSRSATRDSADKDVLSDKVTEMQKDLDKHRERVYQAEREAAERQILIVSLEADLANQGDAVNLFSEKCNDLEHQLEHKTGIIETMEKDLGHTRKVSGAMLGTVEDLRKQLRENTSQVTALKTELGESKNASPPAKMLMMSRKADVTMFALEDEKFRQLHTLIEKQSKVIEELEGSIDSWRKRLDSQQKVVSTLKAMIQFSVENAQTPKTPKTPKGRMLGQMPSSPSPAPKLRERTNSMVSAATNETHHTYSVIRAGGLVERERSARLEEQKDFGDRIMQLEKELAACKAELSVAQLMQLQSERKLRKISLSWQERGLGPVEDFDSDEENTAAKRRMIAAADDSRSKRTARAFRKVSAKSRNLSPISQASSNSSPVKLVVKKRQL